MHQDAETDALDRHGLVLAVWLPAGLVAATLLHYGFGTGGAPFILAGFVAIILGFLGHIIVNTVYDTGFTQAELALGLVVYAMGLVVFGLAMLGGLTDFVPVSIGFGAVFASVVFYLITHHGLRRTFDAFNVIRDFRQ